MPSGWFALAAAASSARALVKDASQPAGYRRR
jgi:hypothetical protein